jgi:allophanate hydrolase subunit 1
MGRPNKYTIAQIKEELEKTLGAITLAAENLGASYNTVRRYVDKSPTLQNLIKHYRERRVDKAELKLEQAITEGQSWAISLVLKTLGRDRGYVERKEVDQRGDVTIHVVYDDEVSSDLAEAAR